MATKMMADDEDGEDTLPTSAAVHRLVYFPLFAKGPACALALAHSGIEWLGAWPQNWQELKPQTPWGELPVLTIPGVGTIGHEIAILNYIGGQTAVMGGGSEAEFVNSQQLMQQAEDIYQKLSKLQDTIKVKDKVPKEQVEAFWTDKDATKHNREFGLHVYLGYLEAFYFKCNAGAGRFTSSGVSVGECKLFATLHSLKLIKDNVFEEYPGLSAFYKRFAEEEKTREILTDGGNMPGPFKQYFV